MKSFNRFEIFLRGIASGILMIFALTFGRMTLANESSAKCAQEDAKKAEAEASTMATWLELFAAYQRYRHCDDGAISEGYSNSVATLLSSHWDQFGSLLPLVRKHPKFRSFVLSHVDGTMTSNQGNAIKINVNERCPTAGSQLCRLIKQRFVELGFR
jgi:hypothetical protein